MTAPQSAAWTDLATSLLLGCVLVPMAASALIFGALWLAGRKR